MSFLAIDVGNTRLKWALYDKPAVDARLLAHGVQFLENIESLEEGDWSSESTSRLLLPGSISIAREIIESWRRGEEPNAPIAPRRPATEEPRGRARPDNRRSHP